MKQCTRCKVIREDSEFRKAPQNMNGLQSHCKYCQNAAKERWRKKNMEQYNATAKSRYRLNPVRAKGRALQKFFNGLTWQECVEKYMQMLTEQNHVCAICKTHDSKTALHVDHCHTTGNVRGLLCASCNLTLGRMKESVEILGSAVQYLKKHQTTQL